MSICRHFVVSVVTLSSVSDDKKHQSIQNLASFVVMSSLLLMRYISILLNTPYKGDDMTTFGYRPRQHWLSLSSPP